MTQNARDLLRRISRLHTALQQHTASCCGIHSLTRCQVLTTLSREGRLTLADLSRHLGIDKGWLSRTVDELVQVDLVHKQPSQIDRRTVELTLTTQGEQQVHALDEELLRQSMRLLQHIPPEEHGGVLRALELVVDALEAESTVGEGVICATT
ncbi:MarR family winged helix-turn-helix transcriptional regulator [Deinococcus hopiensis]|uniref:DNA-binding transcriptional regulator, MarR family n=1 Tax=Deinococcus hopiensis KR-140 TaxID=695939 RepID=A0A1W1UTL6_9DEIO|nr:MarR family transcriptional regulator [Deinococcus hopiensis]SMB84403.1 DNA-binding transcriptional regulator, MarR family [Deinococcus hopiensis KR-140]